MEEKEEVMETEAQALPEPVPEAEAAAEAAGEEAQESFPQFEAHIRSLEQQALELQQQIPEFDLSRELQSPVFLQLTAPGTGISVEDAYYALHRREIQQAQARETTRKVVSAIQSGSRRPLEAGTTAQAPSLTSFRYDSATREQREAFKKELRRAWSRGEKRYPGM